MSDAELLSIGDEVTRIHVMTLLRKTVGEWYVTKYTVPLVADQEAYRIPERVQAGGVRDVTLINDAGVEYDLPELRLEYARTRGNSGRRQGNIRGHFIEDNSIIIRPTPTAADNSICVRYRRQPSELILPTSSNTEVLSSATGSIAVATVTLTAPFTSSMEADVVQAVPPFDVIATGTGAGAGSVFTFTTTVNTDDAGAGDYLCVAGETPIPQVPPVCHDLLVYGIAMVAAQELGKERLYSQLSGTFEAVADGVYEQLRDRNEGSLQKIISHTSALRQRGGWGWWA